MPDLKTLGKDFISVDRLIMDLIKRRMDLSQLVVREKLREEIKKTSVGSTERENEKAERGNRYIEIYNRNRELERLKGIKSTQTALAWIVILRAPSSTFCLESR